MVSQTNTRNVPIVGMIASLSLMLTACVTSMNAIADVDELPTPGPALWTLADDDTTIHLYGSQELLPPDLVWRNDVIDAALAETDMYILEGDSSPEAQAAMQQLVQQLGVYRDGRTLRGVLSDAQEAEIGAVTAQLGAPLSALDQLKPWLASIQIGVLNIVKKGYQSRQGVSAVLVAEAQGRKKTVRYAEETGALIKIISALPEETHVKMLVKAARDINTKPNELDDLNAAWAIGDVDALAELLHGENGAWANEIVYDAMLVQRNERWIDEIQVLLAEHDGIIFLSVGIGHFVGKDSIINMLEGEGLKAVRQ